jgi:hypothetical protein
MIHNPSMRTRTCRLPTRVSHRFARKRNDLNDTIHPAQKVNFEKMMMMMMTSISDRDEGHQNQCVPTSRVSQSVTNTF